MPQQGEEFAEAVGEAVQTATMAFKLMTAIADAVRRKAEQRRDSKGRPLPPKGKAVSDAAGDLRGVLPEDLLKAVTSDGDWPRMAQQLTALRAAGVDMESFLPKLGENAVQVRDSIARNAQRINSQGNDEWADLLRETMPQGLVREAILSSPSWPEIAGQMADLQRLDVDVRGILTAAHDEGLGVDQAVARVTGQGQERQPVSRDALQSFGPLTVGLKMPDSLDLDDREKALDQLGVSRGENERFMRSVREALPGQERLADALVTHRRWPVLAAQMARVEAAEPGSVDRRLAGMAQDAAYAKGTAAMAGKHMLEHAAWRVTEEEPTRAHSPRVSPAAARAESPSVGPTSSASKKAAAPSDPAAAGNRERARTHGTGRSR
ncbi:hypothetical protein [Streptomyces qinglanensis]|uniref:hypothetical protein n=1 Tax=Streptomyces qinglanensis TaxID=943816 RepID=UPI003D719473